jgi:archaellum component FlaC
MEMVNNNDLEQLKMDVQDIKTRLSIMSKDLETIKNLAIAVAKLEEARDNIEKDIEDLKDECDGLRKEIKETYNKLRNGQLKGLREKLKFRDYAIVTLLSAVLATAITLIIEVLL